MLDKGKNMSYRAYVPTYVVRNIDHVFIVPKPLTDPLLELARYCSEIPITYSDLALATFDICDDTCIIMLDLLRRALVYVGKVYNHPTTRIVYVKVPELERRGIETFKAYLFTNEKELENFLRDLINRVSCYFAYRLYRKAYSLRQLLISLSRMRETLEKHGIKIRKQ